MKFEVKLENQVDNLFAFVLGRETKIALLELESVLRSFCFDFDKNNSESCRGINFSILSVTGNVVIIKTEPHRSFTQIGTDNPKVPDLVNQLTTNRLITNKLITILGGTVKIFQIIAESGGDLINDIASAVETSMAGVSGKLNFGISDYRSKPTAQSNINKIGLSVKNMLKKNHNARFVALKEGFELASIVSYKNKLDYKGIEVGIFEIPKSKLQITNKFQILNSEINQDNLPNKLTPNSCLLGRLVAVTNPEEWGKRDYDKPKGDKYSGMTPPKLARMLVNITLGQVKNPKSKLQMSNEISNDKNKKIRNLELEIRNFNDFVVVDPFCGSGNILMEAIMVGCQIVGSDISQKAVDDTKANLDWLNDQNFSKANEPNEPNEPNEANEANKLFLADATTYDFSKLRSSPKGPLAIGAADGRRLTIVTEPYLGQPKKFKQSLNAAKGEYQKIKSLYLNFLKNLQLVTCNLPTICVIFPLVETAEGKQYSLFNECIDEIKQMGYTLSCEPMVYGREYQVVKRQIAFLHLKSQISNLKLKS